MDFKPENRIENSNNKCRLFYIFHARIQEFSPGGGGGVQVNLTKKLWQRFFF